MKSISSKRDPRKIHIKMLVNADEYTEFDRHCNDSGFSHSAALRMLSKQWMQLKDSASRVAMECTGYGHVLPIPSFGKRVNCGAAPARLRP